MVCGPVFPFIILLFILILAKVPLAMIKSLPLLDPYELKSFLSMPLSFKNLPAGELTEIFPAGEIWSVVIESPNTARIFAFSIGFNFYTSLPDPSKKGGL